MNIHTSILIWWATFSFVWRKDPMLYLIN